MVLLYCLVWILSGFAGFWAVLWVGDLWYVVGCHASWALMVGLGVLVFGFVGWYCCLIWLRHFGLGWVGDFVCVVFWRLWVWAGLCLLVDLPE